MAIKKRCNKRMGGQPPLAEIVRCSHTLSHQMVWTDKHKNILDLGLGVETSMTGPPSDAAVKPSEKSPCVWKICGLFPELHSHTIIRIRKEVVGHADGCDCWKILLLVIVRNEARQA